MIMSDLEQRLLDLGYIELFRRLDDQALTTLWNEPGAPGALARLALDGNADPRARFLAAEVVLSRNPQAFDEPQRRELASLYATALRDRFLLSGNEWSFPDGYLGQVGQHLVGLGPAAVAALQTLLEDERPVMYEGSQDAMLADLAHFRTKDLARLFIDRIEQKK
jgi:hypothetical protein